MRVKRIFSIALGFILLCSMFTSAFAESIDFGSIDQSTNFNTIIRGDTHVFETSLALDDRVEGLNDNDIVRIIVELEDKPAIEYATELGIKFSEMSAGSSAQITKNLVNAQTSIKKQIASKELDVKYHNSFTNVVNGFSATTTFANAKEIEQISGVKHVSIANEYHLPEPQMNSSKDIINTPQTWNLGYKGEGMVISIIDTGIDPTHKDMILSNANKAKLNKNSVDALIGSQGLPGKFYTNKVPYGYNYYDDNDTILDLGPGASMHGMHVAGTAGANGDATGIKGVAPESQLLAMKVFGNDPEMRSTFGDIIIRAIDDSVKLGADVINMSLGSTSAFVKPEDPEQKSVARAAANGVFLSVSAGNSSHVGYGYNNQYVAGEFPYAWNPDIGVVGSPGLSADTLQVASIENTHTLSYVIDYEGSDGTAGYIASADGGDPITIFNKQPVPYVFVQYGIDEAPAGFPVRNDFAGIDLAGKIALIERGAPDGYDASFVTKISNAEKHGAIGVIVFNNIRPDQEVLVNMAYPPGGKIPAVSIGRKAGVALQNLTNKLVTFADKTAMLPSPNAGKMSTFTSWGVTPNLDFKPEITAPGGQIFSTLNDNKYGTMSGTSMAAPHVAGGAALILERVAKEFPTLTGNAKVEMAKNLIMSTARQHINKESLLGSNNIAMYPTSPRKQGAGVMDLYAAATTPAVVTNPSTGLSKLALKEINKVTTFPIKVTNFSDQPATYKLSSFVGTDFLYGARFVGQSSSFQNRLEMIEIIDSITEKSPTSFKLLDGTTVSQITVPAHSDLTVNVTLDLTNAVDWWYELPLDVLFENGAFVEGFINLDPISDVPKLNIPFVSFYGKWDQAPIIDYSMLDDDGFPYYGYTILTWLDKAASTYGTYRFYGVSYDGKTGNMHLAAFNPNASEFNSVQPLASFLRNAKEFKVNITDSSGKVLRTLATEKEIRKDYYNNGGSGSSRFRTSENWTWDGKINNKVAPDGLYYFQFESKVDYPGAKWQIYRLPIYVDTTSPTFDRIDYDLNMKTLTAVASDRGRPIYSYTLMDNGNLVVEQQDGVFDLTKYPHLLTGTHALTVVAKNYARNTTESDPITLGEGQIPFVRMLSPEPFGLFNTGELVAKGYVISHGLAELKIDDVNIPFEFNEETKNYDFTTTLHFVDGVHKIDVTAKGTSGLSSNFKRKIFVDTTPPTIEMTNEPPATVGSNVSQVRVTAVISDNFGELRVKLNGSEVFHSEGNWEYIEEPDPVLYNLDEFVELDPGLNIVTVEAYDGAGNSTIKTYEIYRNMEDEDGDTNTVDITARPSASKVNVGEPFSVGIDFSQIEDLYSAKFSVTYDAGLTKGIVVPSEELSVHQSVYHPSSGLIIDEKIVDLGQGKMRSDYIISLTGDINGFTGLGSLATFNFSSQNDGNYNFVVSDVSLLDSFGKEIEVDLLRSGSITIVPVEPEEEYTISGNVIAEAFGPAVDYSMTWYAGNDGVHKVIVKVLNEEGTVVAIGTVQPDGSYTLKVPTGIYTVRVVVPGHFGAEQSVTADGNKTANFGPLTAGDVNGDGVIDLVDLQFVAKQFGKKANADGTWLNARASAANITRSGEVDINDISFILSNFGKRK